MLRSGLALAAGTLALLVASSTFDTAEAQRRSGARAFSGGGHARAFSGPRIGAGPRIHSGRSFGSPGVAARHVQRHHRRHFRRGVIVGVPLGIYGGYSAYGYTAGCDWLRRKALITGNPYWWDRYEACLYGDY
jgi:hypothetical protein